MNKFILALLFFVMSNILFSQKNFSDYINRNIDWKEFDSIQVSLLNYEKENDKLVAQFLKDNPVFKYRFKKDEILKQLAYVYDGMPIYNTTYNLNAAKTVRADKLYLNGGLGLDLQGQGMFVGVWDGGSARSTHVEFGNRTQIVDDGVVENHATHVSGTIIASGSSNTSLKGIANQASLYSYDWSNDLSEMSSAFQNLSLLVSNHSYGADADSAPLWLFGGYDNKARLMDSMLFTSQFLLPIVAAGNDRDNYQQYNPTKNGYDLIGGFNSAKNVITVGAVNQVINYVSPDNVVMSSFSNWGPTDDGRIKPDVVSKGVNVRSTTSASNTSSGFLNGTSMASPAVAGVAILLQQHFSNLYVNPMLAATLKGLILHTADEAGSTPGPDYRFGWGLVNAEKAANVITNRGSSSIIDELTLNNNETYTKTISVQSGEPLMASISWTDRAPTSANSGTVDLQTRMLINDLDIRITNESGTFFPWTLSPANPSFEADNQSDNFRDNFEKIEIEGPSGTYNLSVKHKGSLVGGSQKFSLIITGNQVQNLNTEDLSLSNIVIYPNPSNSILNVSLGSFVDNSIIHVYDVQGRTVKVVNVFENDIKLDVSDLMSGMYVVKLTSNGISTTKKFIKN